MISVRVLLKTRKHRTDDPYQHMTHQHVHTYNFPVIEFKTFVHKTGGLVFEPRVVDHRCALLNSLVLGWNSCSVLLGFQSWSNNEIIMSDDIWWWVLMTEVSPRYFTKHFNVYYRLHHKLIIAETTLQICRNSTVIVSWSETPDKCLCTTTTRTRIRTFSLEHERLSSWPLS